MANETKTSWNGKRSTQRPMNGGKFDDEFERIFKDEKKASLNTSSFVMRVNGKIVNPAEK